MALEFKNCVTEKYIENHLFVVSWKPTIVSARDCWSRRHLSQVIVWLIVNLKNCIWVYKMYVLNEYSSCLNCCQITIKWMRVRGSNIQDGGCFASKMTNSSRNTFEKIISGEKLSEQRSCSQNWWWANLNIWRANYTQRSLEK